MSTRFVVLSMPRTGSWYLIDLLRQHPRVVANGEVLNPDDKAWEPERQACTTAQSLYRLGFRRPTQDPANPPIRAVGFKVLDYQVGLSARHASVFDLLAEDQEVHIIFLSRRNPLEAFRSEVQARITGQWLVRPPAKVQPPPKVVLPVSECFAYIRRAEVFTDTVREQFADHPLLDVHYEELRKDPRPPMSRLYAFLQVPQHSVRPSDMLMQETRPLSETVINYEELEGTFRASRYSHLFPSPS